MDIDIQINDFSPLDPVRVGNVYPVRGGRGLREKNMQILIAMSEPKQYEGVSCMFLVVSKEGKPVGVNRYALHYVEELTPIAFVDGLEDMTLTMRSL